MRGHDALREIQRALKEESQRLAELDSRLSQANEELLVLDSEGAGLLGRLAQLRLQFLHVGEAEPQREYGEQPVMALIEERNAAYRESLARRDALEEERRALTEEGDAASGELAELANRIGEAELEVQRGLEEREDHAERLRLATELQRMAARAAAKAEQSAEELEAKGSAYEADELFLYLWRRQYGTPDYRPGGGPLAPLIRYLDSRVARLTGYADARPNYQRLRELPVRLKEHAEGLRVRAEEAFESLKRLEIEAKAAGGVPALEEAYAKGELAAEALKERAAHLEEREQAVLDELATFANGEDTYYVKAVELLREGLKAAPLEALRSEALATPSPEDDLIVSRLKTLATRRERTARSAAEMKESAAKHRERIRELQTLIGNFLRAGMDSPTTTFPDRSVISGGITQFLTGLLTVEALWRILTQQRSSAQGRSNPTFGSGGFGRGTVWGGGAPQRGGGAGDVAGEIIGGILGGLLGGAVGAGRSASGSRGAPSSQGSRGQPSGGGRGASKGAGGKSGSFRTGGRTRGGKFRTGGKF